MSALTRRSVLGAAMLCRRVALIAATLTLLSVVLACPSFSADRRLFYLAGSQAVDLTIDTGEIAMRAATASDVAGARERLARAGVKAALPAEQAVGFARVRLDERAG